MHQKKVWWLKSSILDLVGKFWNKDHFVGRNISCWPFWIPFVVSTRPLWGKKNIYRQPTPFETVITLNPLILSPEIIIINISKKKSFFVLKAGFIKLQLTELTRIGKQYHLPRFTFYATKCYLNQILKLLVVYACKCIHMYKSMYACMYCNN